MNLSLSKILPMFTDHYTVTVDEYARSHYIKVFEKKYKQHWEITLRTIRLILERYDNIIIDGRSTTAQVDLIAAAPPRRLIKLDFSVAGTHQSPKSSGNRAIIYVDEALHQCRILLIYSKHEICAPNETVKWKHLIRDNFPDIRKEFILG